MFHYFITYPRKRPFISSVSQIMQIMTSPQLDCSTIAIILTVVVAIRMHPPHKNKKWNSHNDISN
jgi:hypothetical protein